MLGSFIHDVQPADKTLHRGPAPAPHPNEEGHGVDNDLLLSKDPPQFLPIFLLTVLQLLLTLCLL